MSLGKIAGALGTASAELRPRGLRFETLARMLEAALGALGLFVFYVIVRKAVTHGILEADEHRAERDARAARLAE